MQRIEDNLAQAILDVLEVKPYPNLRHGIRSFDKNGVVTFTPVPKEHFLDNIDELIEDHKKMSEFIFGLPTADCLKYDANGLSYHSQELVKVLREWDTLTKYRKYKTVTCSVCNGSGARMVAGSGPTPCYCHNGQTTEEVL